MQLINYYVKYNSHNKHESFIGKILFKKSIKKIEDLDKDLDYHFHNRNHYKDNKKNHVPSLGIRMTWFFEVFLYQNWANYNAIVTYSSMLWTNSEIFHKKTM